MSDHIKVLIMIFWLCFPVGLWAQPIPPIDVPMRRSSNTPAPADLPYKPPPPEVLESEDATLEDFLSGAPQAQGPDSENADSLEPVKKFDWTTLPYLPFKRPELKPIADPEF